MDKYKAGETVYYGRCIPKLGIYDLLQLKVRSVDERAVMACEKEGYTYVISLKIDGTLLSKDRGIVLKNLLKEQEKND